MSGCAVRSLSRAWGTLLAPAAMRMNWRIPRECAVELWSPLAQSGAQWGCWHSTERRTLCPLHPLCLIFSDQTLRSCFLPHSLPRTFSSSNQCHGFVHWRNQYSQGSWPAAMDLGEAQEKGRVGSSALLDLLCDLGQMVDLWESQ